jgi:hypothetical protein
MNLRIPGLRGQQLLQRPNGALASPLAAVLLDLLQTKFCLGHARLPPRLNQSTDVTNRFVA